MDRSYLSDPAVVAVSRDFVCVRLLTYENAAEAEMLQQVFRGRDGLENSVFALLDPEGRRPLARTGRSPSFAFRDAAALAVKMGGIAERYPGRRDANEQLDLPLLVDVRRALNVAAADQQQLIIVCGQGKARDQLQSELSRLAWSDDLVGRFLYVAASDRTDWDTIRGSADRPESGLLVVQAGEFGTTGRVVATFAGVPSQQELLAVHDEREAKAIDTQQLRRRGIRRGLRWQTEIPVTDRGGRRR